MRKSLLLLLLASLVLWLSAGRAGAAGPLSPDEVTPSAALDLAVLRAAYPDAVAGLLRAPDGRLLLALKDGTLLAYDDGKARDARQALEDPDIRTMLAQVYPLGPLDAASAHPEPGFDPGRSRVQGFFAALYGHTEAEVRARCTNVRFDGHGALFSTRNGAAQALARVAVRIEALLPQHPQWRSVLRPFGGTLAWREIAGTGRLSMHSFAVAIDLNPHLPYWRTFTINGRHPETVPARRLGFPPEIVAAFEAEGFLWGGKWASFDLMHFEYRPEIILKARVLRGEIGRGEIGRGEVSLP